MEEVKRISPDVRQAEISKRSVMDQLVWEGEALEAREKKVGIWETAAKHKMALVYSRFSIGF